MQIFKVFFNTLFSLYVNIHTTFFIVSIQAQCESFRILLLLLFFINSNDTIESAQKIAVNELFGDFNAFIVRFDWQQSALCIKHTRNE